MESRKLKILVVDDEPRIAESIALALQNRGHITKAVFSGEDAVAAAPGFFPDILLSDERMGGISGIEAAIQIQQASPRTRVIIYYAQTASLDLLDKAYAHGFELFFDPFRPQTLFDLIEERRPA